MPNVENLTPAVLWTTLYGIFALCVLFMIVYKVYDAVCTIVERKKHKKELEKPDFAEEVSQKVIEKLEPRFKKIENNLATDKSRLDGHTVLISEMQESQKNTKNGLVAICNYLMAIVQFGNISSNNDEMKKATSEMNKFLVSMIGGNSK